MNNRLALETDFCQKKKLFIYCCWVHTLNKILQNPDHYPGRKSTTSLVPELTANEENFKNHHHSKLADRQSETHPTHPKSRTRKAGDAHPTPTSMTRRGSASASYSCRRAARAGVLLRPCRHLPPPQFTSPRHLGAHRR
jgi:hypothetical protein